MRCAIVAEICERLIKRTPSCARLARHLYWIESIFATQLRAQVARKLIVNHDAACWSVMTSANRRCDCQVRGAADTMNAMRMGPPARLTVGWLTMFVVGTDLFVVSPLLPMIAADYRISPAVAGLCVTVFALTYMVSAPFFGHVADRIGRRRMLVCCLATFAAANLLTAVATSLIWLLAARVAAGVAAAGVTPSVYALVGG